MNTSRTLCSLLACVGLAACSSTALKVADFAANREIYPGLGFTTKLPGDRTVFLAPVADARREDVLPAGLGGFPIVYDNDSRWERPVPVMLDDVLQSDIRDGNLFAGFAQTAKDADLVVMPSLVTFLTGSMELDSGSRALAELGLRVQVFGPLAADGNRPVLLDQIYGDRQLSDASMRTPSRVLLTGRVLHSTMQKLVRGLDGSNVGRNGMPIVVPSSAPTKVAAPAPASGTR